MSLTAKVNINAVATQVSSLDKGDASYAPSISYAMSLTNGTGANQANMIFTDTRSLALSTSEDLDLAGSLSDAFGNTITFTKIKAIIIHSASTNGDDLQVGGASSNAFEPWVAAAGDIVIIKPGGTFAITAPDANGYAVTAGTADLLKVENMDSAAAASYDITVIGVAS